MARDKGGKKAKKPKVGTAPQAVKKVTTGGIDPDGAGDENLLWRLGRMDLDGTWGWRRLGKADVTTLHSELCACEATTPRLLRYGKRLDEIPTEHLTAKAQERLTEIQEDDALVLSELRLPNRWRVWGFVVGSVFDVLWWDPHHTVCRRLPADTTRR